MAVSVMIKGGETVVAAGLSAFTTMMQLHFEGHIPLSLAGASAMAHCRSLLPDGSLQQQKNVVTPHCRPSQYQAIASAWGAMDPTANSKLNRMVICRSHFISTLLHKIQLPRVVRAGKSGSNTWMNCEVIDLLAERRMTISPARGICN